MAFKSGPVTLGTGDTDIFEMPATRAGAVKLALANIDTVSRTFTLKFYRAATATTRTIANAIAVAPNKVVAFPVPPTMEAGDKLIGLASAANAVVATPTIFTDAAAPAATGFTPIGPWDNGTTYALNALVGHDGDGYVSKTAGNVGNNPASSPTQWLKIVAKGDQGDPGVAGASSLTVVRVVSTGSASPVGDFEAGDAIDGVTLLANDLVLRASASNPELNGVYIVPASGAAARHTDFDAYNEHPGVYFAAMEGTAYADTLWRCTSNRGGTIDVTALTFNRLRLDADGAVDASALGAFVGAVNVAIAESRAANATTVVVKTLAGADPSAADPVFFYFRTATGTYVRRKVTAALSITVASGATMGFSSGVAGRLWLLAVDNDGTVLLALSNRMGTDGPKGLPRNGRVTTAAQNGGNDDSAGVVYAASAVTAKPYCVLGYLTWESGLTTAGTWDAAPSEIVLHGPGGALPGDVIDKKLARYTTHASVGQVIPHDNSIPQNTEGALITSVIVAHESKANWVSMSAGIGTAGISVSADHAAIGIWRDSVADALVATGQEIGTIGHSKNWRCEHAERCATSVDAQYNFRAGTAGNASSILWLNGNSTGRLYGGASSATLEVEVQQG